MARKIDLRACVVAGAFQTQHRSLAEFGMKHLDPGAQTVAGHLFSGDRGLSLPRRA